MLAADTDAMIAAVAAACPDLAGCPVTVHDGGWDSVGIEVDDAWIFKFPRDEDGLEALRVETAVVAVVRPRVTIPVPDMMVMASPVMFTRHRKLPGQALTGGDYARLDDGRRAAMARAVSGFLAELHAIEADWSAIGVEPQDTTPRVQEIADAALPLLAPHLRGAAERALEAQAALGEDPLGWGFCYLDAHGNNFAFDPATGRLNGIFDFGDVAIAPRHGEFIEPASVSRDFARRVIADYAAITGHAVDVARVETMIGVQRLVELAEDAGHPHHGTAVRASAAEWFAAPFLEIASR